MSSFALSEVECLLFKLHRELLHLICAGQGQPYESLSQAAKSTRSKLGCKLFNKIRVVDDAVLLLRQITAESCSLLTKEVEVALAEGGCGVVGVMADHLAKSSSPEEVVGRVRRCRVPHGRSVSPHPQGSVQRALDVVEIGPTDVCDREKKSARDSSWVAGN